MSRFSFLLIIAAILITSCSENKNDAQNADAAFSADSLGQHIAILSSDAFMGRKPFSEGETKTINYLKDQFTAVGLEPGNGDSYFQDVPMVKITTQAATQMQVTSPKDKF